MIELKKDCYKRIDILPIDSFYQHVVKYKIIFLIDFLFFSIQYVVNGINESYAEETFVKCMRILFVGN